VAPSAARADWPAKLDACVQASFDCYRDLHDLHEVLFHRAGHAGPAHERVHEPAHALVTQVIGELLAAGTAAGAFEVADAEVSAALYYASLHAFDQGFRGPDDDRLIRAAKQLFRRSAASPQDDRRRARRNCRTAGKKHVARAFLTARIAIITNLLPNTG
jgi:hypothetical protein